MEREQTEKIINESSVVVPAVSGSAAAVSPQEKYAPGDVFQINEKHGRAGWIGAFVLASEIKSWGIQGFVHHVETHEKMGRAYIRLPYDQLEFIGRAVLVPADEVEAG